MNKPKWNSEGEPENLLAAALDAINWLDLLTKSMESGKVRPVNHSEYAAERVRLADCMAALQKFIRDEQVHPSAIRLTQQPCATVTVCAEERICEDMTNHTRRELLAAD